MRYCDVAQAFHPTSGGIKTYLQEKRRYLADHTEDEHILILPGAADSVRVAAGGRQRTYTVAGPVVPGCAPYRLLARPAALAALLRAERPDVIEVDGPYLAPWVAFAQRRLRPCVVAAFHHTDVAGAYVGPAIRRCAGSRAARVAHRLATRYVRLVYSKCDLVLAAARQYQQQLRRLGCAGVVAAPLGVDLDLFHPARRDAALRAALGAGPDDAVLVYAGRLDAEKRADLLLEAFRLIPVGARARLVVAGEGPLRHRLLEYAAIDSRVVVLPYQAERLALATLLASADAYVTAAPYETFGLSVLEAQACGLPVAGVKSGAMTERVPAGVGVLGAPHSAQSLAGAVAALLASDYRAQGQAARRLIERGHSWTDACRRLFAVCRRAIAARARSRSLTSTVAQQTAR